MAVTAGHLSLPSLPTDLLLLIAAHLGPIDLCHLSAVDKRLLVFVDTVAWRHFVRLQQRSILLDRSQLISPRPSDPTSPSPRHRSIWWYRARFFLRVQRAWTQKVLWPAQEDLPLPKHEQSIHRDAPLVTHQGSVRAPPPSDFHKSAKLAFAIPYLLLGRHRLIVAMRSELYLFERSQLERPCFQSAADPVRGLVGLDFGRAHRLYLNSQAASRDTQARSRPGPWQDITAIKSFDEECDTVLVGYADGTLQTIQIATAGKRGKRGNRPIARVMEAFAASGRQEVADVAVASASCLSSSASDRVGSRNLLLASVSTRGALRLVFSQPKTGKDLDGADEEGDTKHVEEWQVDRDGQALLQSSHTQRSGSSSQTPEEEELVQQGVANAHRGFRSPAFNNAPVTGLAASASTRAWCVLIGGETTDRRWIAVGITGDPALFIYTLDSMRRDQPACTYALASSGRRTSVFALATPPASSLLPGYLLFAGFYDGSVRVYDTRQVFHPEEDSGANDETNDERADSESSVAPDRTLFPIAEFSDTFDDTAVYSLAFGGPGGTKLLAGNSVHARVRIWDVGHLARGPYTQPPPLKTMPGSSNGEQRNWSVFTAYPSKSPQYSIVADFDRIWGVTDRQVWTLDFGAPALEGGRVGADGSVDETDEVANTAMAVEAARRQEQLPGTVAYFSHADLLLKRTRTRLER